MIRWRSWVPHRTVRAAAVASARAPAAALVLDAVRASARVRAAASGGGVYRIGGGVSAPQLVFKVEPEYSEEARKAKFQGTVVLYVVVDEKGQPRDLKVVRPLGLGLDQKAIEAVQKWRFKPGLKDGRPVSVSAQIEVNFRLL